MNRNMLIGVHAVLGVLAVAVGLILALYPSGSLVGFDQGWLQDSPFSDYRVPGLVLAFVVGGANLGCAVLQSKRHIYATGASLIASLLMLAWFGVEYPAIGYRHWSQFFWPMLSIIVAGLAMSELASATRHHLQHR